MNTSGTTCAGLPVVNWALSPPSPDHLCTVDKKSRIVFAVGFPAELARGEVQSLPESGRLKLKRGHYCWAQLQPHTCDERGLDPPEAPAEGCLPGGQWASRGGGDLTGQLSRTQGSQTSLLPLHWGASLFISSLFPETPLSSLDLDFWNLEQLSS